MEKTLRQITNYEIFLGSVVRVNRHLHEGLSLFLVLQGTIEVELNGQMLYMQQDSCFCINNGEIYGLSTEGGCVLLGFHFGIQYLKEECPQLLKYTYFCDESQEESYSLLKKNIADSAFCYLKKEEGADLMFKSALYKMLYLLQQYFRLEELPSAVEEQLVDFRVRTILSYIQKNYKNRISLKELAENEYMSVQYLSKLFQRKMGINLSRYLSMLRLESASKDLINTDISMTQIALNNGFANVKAFNTQFKKNYKELPSEYRKQNRLTKDSKEDRFSFTALKKGESFDILVKYLSQYNQEQKTSKTLTLKVDMTAMKSNKICQYKRILNIGEIESCLRFDVRSQIIDAAAKIKFDYIYFSHFFPSQRKCKIHLDTLLLTDYIECFHFFCKLNLTPFIKIDLKDFINLEKHSILEEICSELTALLTEIRQEYQRGKELIWKFDICGTSEELRCYYIPIRKSIRRVMRQAHTGIHVEFRNGWQNELEGFFTKVPRTELDFLSFDMDLNLIQMPADAQEFSRSCRSQTHTKVTQLHEVLSRSQMNFCAIYLINWNVLTGKTLLEAGEFHRSALIADQLLEISRYVNGAGMALNLRIPNAEKTDSDLLTYNLSLFLYKTVKRSLFFIMGFFNSFKDQLLYCDENFICTAGSGEQTIYTFFLYNPQYMDPFNALDNIRTKNYSISLSAQCTHLVPGFYRIKKTILNRDCGSTYLKLLKGKCSRALNMEEFDEYLESSVYPEVDIYDVEIGDNFLLSQDLSLNSVVFYVMKKLS